VNPKLLRLALAAALFAAWVGYLGYLVYALPAPTNNPLVDSLRPAPTRLTPVVSRPQFLISTLDVVGTVDVAPGTVKIEDVLHSPDKISPAGAVGCSLRVFYPAGPTKGDEIHVTNLREADPRLPEQGTVGPCLLLLQEKKRDDGTTYRIIAPVPPSPGYSRGQFLIYSADRERLAEYHSLKKPERPEAAP
jgi:hypothetical protein